MDDAERSTRRQGMDEARRIWLEVVNGEPPARPDTPEEARFRELFRKKHEATAAETRKGDGPPSPIYYLKGCDESVWRETTGRLDLSPKQILRPGGWEDVPPMDPKAWLTNTRRATAERAREVAAELGLPTDVFE